MTWKALKTRAILVALVGLAAAPAAATGDLSCSIGDANVDFSLLAATNREHGTIVNVTESTLRLKSATLLKTAPGFKGELKVEQENIIQQWFFERDLRIAVNVDNEHGELLLAIVGQLGRNQSSYAGRYVLKVSNAGNSRTVTGRIKGCSADG